MSSRLQYIYIYNIINKLPKLNHRNILTLGDVVFAMNCFGAVDIKVINCMGCIDIRDKHQQNKVIREETEQKYGDGTRSKDAICW